MDEDAAQRRETAAHVGNHSLNSYLMAADQHHALQHNHNLFLCINILCLLMTRD